MELRNIKAAVCIVWSLTYLNIQYTFIMERIQIDLLNEFKENWITLFFIKWCNYLGNCITGNLESVLRNLKSYERWYWEGLVRRSMIQTRQSPSVSYCAIFHSQNIVVCICMWHKLVLYAVLLSYILSVIFIESKEYSLLCEIGHYLLIWKTLNRLSTSQCCPLLSNNSRTVFLPL